MNDERQKAFHDEGKKTKNSHKSEMMLMFEMIKKESKKCVTVSFFIISVSFLQTTKKKAPVSTSTPHDTVSYMKQKIDMKIEVQATFMLNDVALFNKTIFQIILHWR